MGFRSKMLLLLIVYFAGFATAMYTLGPKPVSGEIQTVATEEKPGIDLESFKNGEFAASFNKGLHKCLAFGKDAAVKAGLYLRDYCREQDKNTDS